MCVCVCVCACVCVCLCVYAIQIQMSNARKKPLHKFTKKNGSSKRYIRLINVNQLTKLKNLGKNYQKEC